MTSEKFIVRIQEADFEVAQCYQELQQLARGSGAMVLFVGSVRDLHHSGDGTVSDRVDDRVCDRILYLELSQYEPMTQKLCQQIIDAASERFSIDAAIVVHRIGKLKAHEQIVLVAVASQHRQAAFEAASYIMDYLKSEAALWKKEVRDSGSSWIQVRRADENAIHQWQETDKRVQD